jgi:DNA-binding NarL/FixJ family response regulator
MFRVEEKTVLERDSVARRPRASRPRACNRGHEPTSQRIVLADGHRLLRQGLRRLLESEVRRGFEVAGEAADGLEAVALVQKVRPDVLILEVNMHGLNGVEVTRLASREHAPLRVLALSSMAHPGTIDRMLRAGAAGYLLKRSPVEELVLAIETIVSGRRYLGESVPEILGRARPRHRGALDTRVQTALTSRERQVLQLVAEGRTTREIACLLAVSIKTVETHRVNLMNRLGIRDTASLTKYALREGLTALDV